MTHMKQFVFILGLLLIVSIRVMAEEEDAPVQTGFRPDAPTYGIRGAYTVGARDLVIEGDAPLDITVWYPALNEDGQEEAIDYPYVVKMGMPDAIATVSGHAIRDAAYQLDDAPYPLVMLSPGFILGRSTYAWLAEHLASHGFVVIAPEHHEQFDETMGDFWKAAVLRPQDMHGVLAYVDAQVGTDGRLAGLIDPQTVAVMGHSLGGYTTLTMAGARYNVEGFQTTCATAEEAGDPSAWLCGLLLPYTADMAELAGFESIPDGLWESWGDDRIDAVIPMAGDAYMFGEAGLAEITIPVMAIGGTADTGTPFLWGPQPTYDDVSSGTKALVGLENAEHMIFGSTCETAPWFTEIGFYEMCADAVWDVDRAHDLINHFVTAFLLAELQQDADAAAALAPDAVTFTGVSYEAQGY